MAPQCIAGYNPAVPNCKLSTPPTTLPDDALHVVGAAILDGPRCLAVQRSATMKTPLKWEFPGGKVESGEAPRAALEREIREELGLVIQIERWLARGVHPTTHRSLVLDVYLARAVAGRLELREHRRARWLTAVELGELDWAAPDVPVVAALTEHLAHRFPAPPGASQS
jgi:8-oxo-dGTP diphosphatase